MGSDLSPSHLNRIHMKGNITFSHHMWNIVICCLIWIKVRWFWFWCTTYITWYQDIKCSLLSNGKIACHGITACQDVRRQDARNYRRLLFDSCIHVGSGATSQRWFERDQGCFHCTLVSEMELKQEHISVFCDDNQRFLSTFMTGNSEKLGSSRIYSIR